jgi:ribonuclease-3
MIAYFDGPGPDYKTILQELASAHLHALPDYRITERGPDHQKEFTATVHLGGRAWGSGIGRSKKEAEQQAAYEAYVRLIAKVD